jgi:DNA repair protein RecO (recombination protein O)
MRSESSTWANNRRTAVRTELHPAYIIHRRRYRETSLLLECLSADYGRVGVVARGAIGRRKRGGDAIQAFQHYKMSWSGRAELHTLTGLEPVGTALTLVGERLFSGFYVNELIMRLTGRHDPNAGLFAIYEQTLTSLARPAAAIEPILRRFEKSLLETCGYGLELVREVGSGAEIDPSRTYYYVVERGPMPAADGDHGIFVSGQTLLALAGRRDFRAPQLQEAKRLMRFVLRQYIGDRPLASRALFRAPTTAASSGRF